MTGEDDRRTDKLLSELLCEQAPDAFVFADVSGAIRLWNPSAERLFGYAATEAMGSNLDMIIPERFRNAHWRGFERAIETGATKYAGRTLTTRGAHKDGRTLYVALTFSLVRDGDGKIIGALAIARDCTESYLAEKALRERLSEAEAKAAGGSSAN
jgi:PAS domain S-box-containing protein